MITVRLAESKADVETCLRLRWTVFVEEQGVRPSDEIDLHDRSDAVHVLALLDGVPAGAARLIFPEPVATPGLAKLQRMAVIDDVRKLGVGRALLSFLEAEARRRGARAFTLGAQTHARGFYEKQGYAAVGAEFDDAGLPHVRMDKPA
jgi:predicted GNAT family N-acyltransferase